MRKIIAILATAALAACGTTKQATTAGTSKTATAETARQHPLDYIRKVNDNAVYAKNIVAKTDVTLNAMGRDVSVGGKLYMRRDEVIRILLTPLGLMEVGRLEFTPDYVLLINRMNKEYVKAKYSDVDFLSANGLDFYSLQSLFWNELFQPGKHQLTDSDLSHFTLDNADITQTAGKLSFNWNTDTSRALITQALITYATGTPQSSSVRMEYGDFVPMGSKRFPSKEKVTFDSKQFKGGKMTLQFLLSGFSNDSKWDARTAVSEKYTQITAEQFFARLGGM